jgi:hypothetical protein
MLAVVAVCFLASTGCTKRNKPGDPDVQAKAKETDPQSKPGFKKGDHSGWWCQEHGIPEHLCSLCSEEVAAKLKKEGDWCKIHDRALSQCFKCDPSKYARFEAMYVAKYNKKPEKPPQEEFEK